MKTFKEREKRSKTTLTVILDPLVKNQEESTLLKLLGDRTDLFFVFSKDWTKNKKPAKFSKIYGATYFGLQEEKETEVNLIWEALDYGREFGEGYLGYFVVLNNLSPDYLNSISSLGESLIETSVWFSEELGWEYLSSIYEDKRGKVRRFLEDLISSPLNDLYKSYESKTTNDSIIFLREVTIIKLEEYFNENSFYRESFNHSEFKTFISSTVDQICPETKININIRDAKT